ncbi:hypothetical protein PF008_g17392 [Phytophthora fragariae]|uniref:Uncharacterized protein n=1 Tax=Phytophthora fragariae TaxID=53985 RepID=A0A6G0R9S0_9STRA|nr:hypothetical protein PF008_g17392 [Phytophthora fragariae]
MMTRGDVELEKASHYPAMTMMTNEVKPEKAPGDVKLEKASRQLTQLQLRSNAR